MCCRDLVRGHITLLYHSLFSLQLFNDTLVIAEEVENEFSALDDWIKATNTELRKESVELPENPEPEIERIKVNFFSTFNFKLISLIVENFSMKSLVDKFG